MLRPPQRPGRGGIAASRMRKRHISTRRALSLPQAGIPRGRLVSRLIGLHDQACTSSLTVPCFGCRSMPGWSRTSPPRRSCAPRSTLRSVSGRRTCPALPATRCWPCDPTPLFPFARCCLRSLTTCRCCLHGLTTCFPLPQLGGGDGCIHAAVVPAASSELPAAAVSAQAQAGAAAHARPRGLTVLHIAAAEGASAAVLKAALSGHVVDGHSTRIPVDTEDEHGCTALHFAAAAGAVEVPGYARDPLQSGVWRRAAHGPPLWSVAAFLNTCSSRWRAGG